MHKHLLIALTAISLSTPVFAGELLHIRGDNEQTVIGVDVLELVRQWRIARTSTEYYEGPVQVGGYVEGGLYADASTGVSDGTPVIASEEREVKTGAWNATKEVIGNNKGKVLAAAALGLAYWAYDDKRHDDRKKQEIASATAVPTVSINGNGNTVQFGNDDSRQSSDRSTHDNPTTSTSTTSSP